MLRKPKASRLLTTLNFGHVHWALSFTKEIVTIWCEEKLRGLLSDFVGRISGFHLRISFNGQFLSAILPMASWLLNKLITSRDYKKLLENQVLLSS